MVTLVGDAVVPASLTRTANGRRVCIVTSAPVSCNPRVVKEADALSTAGYDVRVVASQHVDWVVEWDQALMAHRSWKLDAIRWDDHESGKLRLRSGLRQRVFGKLANISDQWLIPERAYSRLFTEQLRSATKQPCDLFIAHNPQALPVAAAAAKHFGVEFAFDAEDLHTGEFPWGDRSPEFRLLSLLESKYLPLCAYVTAPSDEISDALAELYHIRRPTTIHNVFSWTERQALDGLIKDRRGSSLSLYWYSQIVGLDRGLQDVIRAVASLSEPVQIHIRGDMNDTVRSELNQLANSVGVNDLIYFHSPVRPDELLSRATEHDVGLALEQPVNQNRTLTVTNKIFFYLLAGLSIAATATAGQRRILNTSSDVGFLYEPGDYKLLANGLQRFINSPALLKQQKGAALSAARDRWNWETESQRLIDVVGSMMANRPIYVPALKPKES